MKRSELNNFINRFVAVKLFDSSTYIGYLHQTGSEEFKDDPNLYLPKNRYVLLDDTNAICSCVFCASHVKKLIQGGIINENNESKSNLDA